MARKKKDPEGRMSLAEHLVELRKRLTYAALGLVVGVVIGWNLTPFVWDALREPVLQVAADQGRQAQLNYGDITSAFNVQLQIAFFISAIITCPIWLYQIWAFLVPGLTKRERMWGITFLGIAIPLFIAGCYAGWTVFPNIVRLMTSFAPDQDSQIMSATVYLTFVLRLMLVIGIAFVLPLILVLLNFLGVITGKSIIRSWRWAILVIIVFTAMATPAADVVSMFLLAIPMIVLYLAAAAIALIHDRRAAKRLALTEQEYGLAP